MKTVNVKDVVAWLIERESEDGSGIAYMVEAKDRKTLPRLWWSNNASLGKKFNCKIDASAYLLANTLMRPTDTALAKAKVAEHMWLAPSPAPATAGDCSPDKLAPPQQVAVEARHWKAACKERLLGLDGFDRDTDWIEQRAKALAEAEGVK